jgi:hypothetical protein
MGNCRAGTMCSHRGRQRRCPRSGPPILGRSWCQPTLPPGDVAVNGHDGGTQEAELAAFADQDDGPVVAARDELRLARLRRGLPTADTIALIGTMTPGTEPHAEAPRIADELRLAEAEAEAGRGNLDRAATLLSEASDGARGRPGATRILAEADVAAAEACAQREDWACAVGRLKWAAFRQHPRADPLRATFAARGRHRASALGRSAGPPDRDHA